MDDQSPLRNLDLDKDKSELRQVGPDGKETVIKLTIDTFKLKMFALLMCKGSAREKSSELFSAIVGPAGMKVGKDQISWRSTRMQSAFKKLLWFSEIFPKKY